MNAGRAADATFTAYSSRLQLLVVTAGVLPLVVIGAVSLPLLPGAPLAARLIGLVILAPLLTWLAINVRLVFFRKPIIEVDGEGLLWRRWSRKRIGWDAVQRWQVRRHMGIAFVTLWLHQPSEYRSTTIHRLLAPANKWLGMGDVTLNAGGTNRSFEELAAAIGRYAPPPELPEDPRLARRLLAAREKRGRAAGS